MINLTRRMAHSQKLQAFIEKNRAEELANIHKLMVGFFNVGKIDYAGSNSQLAQNGRNGVMLQINGAINKCEFSEPEEVISWLRANLGNHWVNILDTLAKEHEFDEARMSNEGLVAVANASPLSESLKAKQPEIDYQPYFEKEQ